MMFFSHQHSEGISIQNTLIKWGTKRTDVWKLLTIPHETVDKGNLYSKGTVFDDYHSVEINGTEASGYSFQLGYDTNDELIEISIIWNFQIRINDLTLKAGTDFNTIREELADSNFMYLENDPNEIRITDLNINLATASTKDFIPKAELLEYVYISA